MGYLTQLADVAQRTGYPVTEVDGWRDRGHGPQPDVRGIVAHHTAGPAGGGDYPSLAVVADGRSDLPGPLSHLGIGRSGRIYVIAAGRCWHAGRVNRTSHTNDAAIGIEAENDGRQPWPAAQLDAYRRLCAELCREYGLAAAAVLGHREVAPGRKPDPHSIDLDEFRGDVAALIDTPEEDDVPTYVSVNKTGDSRTEEPSRGEWHQVYFDRNNSAGTEGHHADGDWPSLVRGPADYTGHVALRLSDVGEGAPCQARIVEVAADGDGWAVVERDNPVEFTGTGGETFVHVPATGYVAADRRLRVEVVHYCDEGAAPRVVGGEARFQVWER